MLFRSEGSPESASLIAEPLTLVSTWRERVLPAILFIATFASTTFAGLWYAGYGDGGFLSTAVAAAADPTILFYGLPFSFTFLIILLADFKRRHMIVGEIQRNGQVLLFQFAARL